MIPQSLTRDLIDCVHAKLGHPVLYKTISYISKFYYWKFMNREIKKFVLACDLC